MICPDKFSKSLFANGVSFVSGVPDSLLKYLNVSLLKTFPKNKIINATNEGSAVAYAIGYYLSTGKIKLLIS